MKKLLLILGIFFCLPSWAIKVTYISQTENISPYWQKVYAVTQAAAKSLDIELTIIEGQGHRIYQSEVISSLLKKESFQPELLIFHAYALTAYDTFRQLEAAQIPFVTVSSFAINNNVPDKNALGVPQQNFKYWLAEHAIDDKQGGAQLANSLINQAIQKKVTSNLDGESQLKLLALSGDLIHESLLRSEGVSESAELKSNVVLVQDISANWLYESAKQMFKALYVRHKGIDIVWASSDVMARGALQGAIELSLVPNQDIFIGGFDWDSDALALIEQEKINASAGGQFYNIAWLLVKVYDHFNNKPFTLEQSEISSHYLVLDKDNLSHYKALVDTSRLAAVNFYCFTKVNTKEKDYKFSFEKVLTMMNSKDKLQCH